MTKIGSIALLAGMMEIAGEAVPMGENHENLAGKRGLSPIISDTVGKYCWEHERHPSRVGELLSLSQFQ